MQVRECVVTTCVCVFMCVCVCIKVAVVQFLVHCSGAGGVQILPDQSCSPGLHDPSNKQAWRKI